MSIFKKTQPDNVYRDEETTEKTDYAVVKTYDGNLFYKAMEIVSSPSNKYLTNIQNGNIKKEQFFDIMRKQLYQFSTDEDQIKDTLDQLDKWIWGYYILEDFLNDDRISDIKVHNENNIRLKRMGKRIGTDVKFRDKADYLRFIDNVCAKNKVSLTDINSVLVFSDINGNDKARLRFNLTGGNINTSGYPVLHIRKILKEKKTLTALTTAKENYMIPKDLLPYLEHVARDMDGMLVTGKGASGKSTFMNAMIEKIPYDNSISVIQESDELFSDTHPDIMVQHIVQTQGDGKISYDLRKLAKNGLRADVDYYIIGEITGDEAESFADAAYTGHKCWTSSHGKSAKDGLNKLIDYIVRATRYNRHEVIKMLTSLQVIVFMKNYKIQEIVELQGIDSTGEFKFKTVYDVNNPEESDALAYGRQMNRIQEIASKEKEEGK